MQKVSFFQIIASCALIALIGLSCRVTLISGYNADIVQQVSNMKRNFNLHCIKVGRTLNDDDTVNQSYYNFLDYYDNMQVDLLMLSDKAKYLGKKSVIVKQHIANLDTTMHMFESIHQYGLRDHSPAIMYSRDAVNSAMDAILVLQSELRTSTRLK